jgi:hypothetical protein
MATKEQLIEEGKISDDRLITSFTMDIDILEDDPVVFICRGYLRQEKKELNSNNWKYREYALSVTHRNDVVASTKVLKSLFSLAGDHDKDWKELNDPTF